ncbi:Uncharacterised protein [Mycobacteroides abscessus]|uniref:Uncharacterized protein n=3 Tax=Mycobacteroides abscessus TaxID=36809 RepID=A0A1T8BJB9_9MYCO|nr:hypothetical protein J108_15255 [Mycobacteroides abscessus subsp. bolletii CRM-0020]MBE5403618.1 hypothetical protein [Mycobacteroides abscessus]SHP16021.1 Uncharacterised protein [Mycobacteroides abscessus subsp. abscessus]SIN08162.1 Uncharacterised protein [Mycobacteroides abscessus subsp. bolletii]SKD22081.1 Uncharacterised protein [Mycobacteroides abscessus subsp. massiliense]
MILAVTDFWYLVLTVVGFALCVAVVRGLQALS